MSFYLQKNSLKKRSIPDAAKKNTTPGSALFSLKEKNMPSQFITHNNSGAASFYQRR